MSSEISGVRIGGSGEPAPLVNLVVVLPLAHVGQSTRSKGAAFIHSHTNRVFFHFRSFARLHVMLLIAYLLVRLCVLVYLCALVRLELRLSSVIGLNRG